MTAQASPPVRPQPRFGTHRLSCRPVAGCDGAFYSWLFGLPETVAHRPDKTPLAPSVAERQLQRDIEHWTEHGFGRWALSHAGQVVGLGGLTVKPGFDGLNLSYHLLPEMWGQGLASEFVRAAIDHARDELDAGELYGLVRPTNIASIRVMEKAGFRDHGLHRVHGGPMRELRLVL
ncbi:GNAT family N-acetyltransferase [Rhodobacterales bacterium HKCCE3408]|nr:GNAT family N-acetyltransferase [Rhodobacterales bacterium HKCCE3408]